MTEKEFTQEEAIEFLKDQLKRSGLSLTDFAASLGISKQKFSGILTGRQFPNEDVGFKRAKSRFVRVGR
jgi:transcriptional regulator with XRE-family HTH domain